MSPTNPMNPSNMTSPAGLSIGKLSARNTDDFANATLTPNYFSRPSDTNDPHTDRVTPLKVFNINDASNISGSHLSPLRVEDPSNAANKSIQ